jgi:glycosyltransferase involved in cell wall biosynthesis
MSSDGDGRAGRRLRVLVLARSFPNPVFPTLGLWTERPMAALAERCDVRVVSPVPYCPPLPDIGRLRQYSRFRGVPRVHERAGMAVYHPRFLVGPGSSLSALEVDTYHLGVRACVDRLWRQRPFDLIHATFITPDGAVAHRLSRRYGVPFLVTELAPWTSSLDRRTVRRHALPAARAAFTILALSTHVEQTIRAYAGDDVHVRVVPPGVDGSAFRPDPSAERVPDQVLFVGFVNFNKGVDVLLRAFAELKTRGEPGRLVLAGGAYYRNTRLQMEQLQGLATSLGVDDRVTFLGNQLPPDVARLMRESAVVVLPSRAEAFGAVLAEALASGTPVVASRSGGPEDIVTDDVGRLVPVGDHVALADAIAHVLRRRDTYRPEALREYALARFGLTTVADRIHDAYLEATAGAAHASSNSGARAGEAA